MERALPRTVPGGPGPDSASASGLESPARHLLEHGRLDAVLRGRLLLRLPVDHPPALAEVVRPPDRAAAGNLVPGDGSPCAVSGAQSGPPPRACRPLLLGHL